MLLLRPKTIKLACSVFMGLFLFGVSFVPVMGMHDSSMSGGCPFIDIMDGAAGCTMTPLQHIAAAQNMFSAIPQDKNTLPIFLLLMAAIAVLPFLKNLFSPPLILVPISLSRSRFVPPLSALQEAFSRGILNPKAF